MNGTRMNQFVAPTSFITSISRRRANMAMRIVFRISTHGGEQQHDDMAIEHRRRPCARSACIGRRSLAAKRDLVHARLRLELVADAPAMTSLSSVLGTTRKYGGMSLTVSDSAIVFWSSEDALELLVGRRACRRTVLASSTCGLSASAVPHASDLVLGGVGLHEDDELDAALPLHELRCRRPGGRSSATPSRSERHRRR